MRNLTHMPLPVPVPPPCRQLLDGIEAAVNDFRRANKGAHSDLTYMRIDGSVPPEKRDNYVQDFQAEENCRVRGGAGGL
jgi:hypothetical protein